MRYDSETKKLGKQRVREREEERGRKREREEERGRKREREEKRD